MEAWVGVRVKFLLHEQMFYTMTSVLVHSQFPRQDVRKKVFWVVILKTKLSVKREYRLNVLTNLAYPLQQ